MIRSVCWVFKAVCMVMFITSVSSLALAEPEVDKIEKRLLSHSDANSALAMPSSKRVDESPSVNLIEMMMSLLFVVVLIIIIAWFMRRLGFTQNNSTIRSVATHSLGGKESLVLVEVGEKQFLLGVAPGRVAMLERFSTPIVDIKEERATKEFSQRLRDIIKHQQQPKRG